MLFRSVSQSRYWGDVRKAVGVLGQKSPNVIGRPSWPNNDVASKRGAKASECGVYLRSQWDADAANRFLTLSLMKNGTTFFHTHYVADGDKYGWRKEPLWEMVPQKLDEDHFRCQNCGMEMDGKLETAPESCVNCGAPQSMLTFEESEMVPVATQTGVKEYPNGTVELDIYSGYDVTTPFFVKKKDWNKCPWLWLQKEEDAGWCLDQWLLS